MRHVVSVLILFCAALSGQGLAAQAEAPAAIASEQAIETAPVVIDDMTLFSVRGIQAFPAEERAGAIADRIKKIAADRNIPPASLTLAEAEYSTDIMAGDKRIVSIHDFDTAFDRISREILAKAYLAKIKSSIEKYRQDRSPESLAEEQAIPSW